MTLRNRVAIPLLLASCAMVLASCAGQPASNPHKNLKLETIIRPFSDAPIYLYREVPPPQ